MADKYNKLEPKIPKEVIFSLIGFVVIIIALFIIITPSNAQRIYQAFEATDVNDSFTEDHPFYEVNANQLERRINSEDYVFVFFGTPDSDAAVAYLGTFQKYFENDDIDQYVNHIYYFNPAEDEDGFADLQETYDDLSSSNFQAALFINGEYAVKFASNGITDDQLINRAVNDFYQDSVDAIEAAA